MPAGFNMEGKQLVQVINDWWTCPMNACLRPILHAMPSLIIWELWKKINIGLHGRIVSLNSILYQVSLNVQLLLKVQRILYSRATVNRPDLYQNLASHVPKLKYTKVW